MSLVVFTGFVGLVVAPGHLHPVLAAVAVLCIAVGAGASGAINMWYDRDIDAVMRRTAARPLPAGRMVPGEALGFGVVLAVGSVLVMGLAVNWVAAGLLALTIAFYVFVYTIWLKRRTPQNIVIGGAAGAFPPLIGWAAVSGDIGWGAIALFAIIFFWTPPHFWALALYRADDYAEAGVPMLPVVAGCARDQAADAALHAGAVAGDVRRRGSRGRRLGLRRSAPRCLSVLFTAMRGPRLARRRATRSARQMFAFSLLYLFLIFACCWSTMRRGLGRGLAVMADGRSAERRASG